MRKTIKIFIASSIVEEEAKLDRLLIENFIYRNSNDFEEQYDIKIKPILCENLDEAYSSVRKQEEYNEEIRDSEICFIIFFKKAGPYTQEEFEVARKAFEQSGKPKIYIFFKNLKEGEGEQQLYDFRKKLEQEFNQYIHTFDHIDTIKMRILAVLHEMKFVEIKTRNGYCVINDEPVMALSQVSEFKNNDRLKTLKLKLKDLENYKNKILEEIKNNEQYSIELNKTNERINEIKDKIRDLEDKIFNVSLSLSYDLSSKMTVRQKKAYDLFERGKTYEAIEELSSTEIMADFERVERLHSSEIKNKAQECIAEQRLAISLLQQNVRMSLAAEQEIIDRYKLIVPIATKYMIEIDVLYDYIMFMDNDCVVNDKNELLKIARELFRIYYENPQYRTLYNMYDVCNIIAENLSENDIKKQYYMFMAIQSLDEYLDSVEDKDSCIYAYDCMRVAELPGISDEKVVSLYKTAISIFESMEKTIRIKKQISFCKEQIKSILG